MDDFHHSAGHLVSENDQKADSGQEVDDRHGRHNLTGNRGDALQAAQGDSRDDDRQDDGRVDGVQPDGQLRDIDDGVHLGEGADAEVGDEHAGDGEEDCQGAPFPAHAVFNVEHGAADDFPFLIVAAVADRQQAFGIFRGHAEEGSHPHPEQGAGAAGLDRRGDADDVARADGGGQGRAQGAEGRRVALAVALRLEDQSQGARQLAYLQQAQAQAQVYARAHQQDQQRRSPDEAVDCIQ